MRRISFDKYENKYNNVLNHAWPIRSCFGLGDAACPAGSYVGVIVKNKEDMHRGGLMQYIFVVSLVIFQIIFSNVEASETSKNGVSIDDSKTITYRYINESKFGFDVGARFGKGHAESINNYHRDSSTAQLMFGLRKYDGKSNMDRFYGANLIMTYIGEEYNGNSNGDPRFARIEIVYGLEYAINPNIALEGRVGFSASYYDNTNGDQKSRNYTIPITGIAVNYYW